jgi:hypothetical protein
MGILRRLLRCRKRRESASRLCLLTETTPARRTPGRPAAAGTLIYQNLYGDTEAPAGALASDEEVDYMPDGNIVISQPSKESISAEPEATQNPNDDAAITDYHNSSIAKSGGKAPGKNQSGNDEAVAIN